MPDTKYGGSIPPGDMFGSNTVPPYGIDLSAPIHFDTYKGPSVPGYGANGIGVQTYAIGGTGNAPKTGGLDSPTITANGVAGAVSANPDEPISLAPGVTVTGSLIPQNWFVRGTIIILGFVFVAVGLSMFKGPAIAVIQKAAGA